MFQAYRCDHCGQGAPRANAAALARDGWTLVRVRDTYGNPVLSWRCERCTSTAAAERVRVRHDVRVTDPQVGLRH